MKKSKSLNARKKIGQLNILLLVSSANMGQKLFFCFNLGVLQTISTNLKTNQKIIFWINEKSAQINSVSVLKQRCSELFFISENFVF